MSRRQGNGVALNENFCAPSPCHTPSRSGKEGALVDCYVPLSMSAFVQSLLRMDLEGHRRFRSHRWQTVRWGLSAVVLMVAVRVVHTEQTLSAADLIAKLGDDEARGIARPHGLFNDGDTWTTLMSPPLSTVLIDSQSLVYSPLPLNKTDIEYIITRGDFLDIPRSSVAGLAAYIGDQKTYKSIESNLSGPASNPTYHVQQQALFYALLQQNYHFYDAIKGGTHGPVPEFALCVASATGMPQKNLVGQRFVIEGMNLRITW